MDEGEAMAKEVSARIVPADGEGASAEESEKGL